MPIDADEWESGTVSADTWDEENDPLGTEKRLIVAFLGEDVGKAYTRTEIIKGVEFAADDAPGTREGVLVGYNGETWDGGFDLPFLRTRYAACDRAWPFDGLPYADLVPVIRDLFNTTIDGEEPADLDTAYEILCAGAADVSDPFAASEDAVTAFENGRVEDVVLHNVADLRRTGQVSSLAERYCSKSDFGLKSLTPTVRDAD